MKKDSRPLRRYVLITPVKNEEENLPKLIQSVVEQTIRPIVWIIVDDGSIDSSPEIIREAEIKYDWIQSIRLSGMDRDIWLHLPNVLKKCFNFGVEYCENEGIDYDYVGTVDGDIILEDVYYENLIRKFEENPRLGIASGRAWELRGDQMRYRKDKYPGGVRLCRRKCFEDCDGIPLSYSWDSVLNVKAMLRGWDVRKYDDSKHYLQRLSFDAEGLWNGNKKYGEGSYYLGINFFYAIAKGLRLSFEKPYYIGLAYFYGYFSNLMLRKKQIDDKEIKNYYRYTRPKEIILYYSDALKRVFKRKS